MLDPLCRIRSLVGGESYTDQLRFSPHKTDRRVLGRVEIEILALFKALVSCSHRNNAFNSKDTKVNVVVIPTHEIKSLDLIPELVLVKTVAALPARV